MACFMSAPRIALSVTSLMHPFVHFPLPSFQQVGEAAGDLPIGAELRNNYRAFDMPSWYLDYCAHHKFTDVRSAVLEEVDGPK